MKSYVTAALLALASDCALAATPTPAAEYVNELFYDGFSGTAGALPSSDNWIYDTGTQYDSPYASADWGNDEVQSYTTDSSNLELNGNGVLVITAVKSSSGDWTSGRIETVATDFEAPAGGKMLIQARIKLPEITEDDGLGYWPAFWAVGAAYRGNYTNWPEVGEYDICEAVNGGTTVDQGLHCDVDPGGVCDEPDGIASSSTCGKNPCFGYWHTYGLVVDRSVTPHVLEYKINGKTSKIINETTLGTAIWQETVNHGYFLILDLAMGGSYPNAVAGVTTPTDDTVSGKSMRVDYVGVWTT